MFDIGFYELALIGVLALLVLGPKRLPEAARTAGLWVGKLRLFISNVKQDIDREIESGEIEELLRLKEELGKARTLIEESSNSIYKQADKVADEISAEIKSIRSPAGDTTKKLTKKKKKASKKKAGKKKSARKKTTKRKAR